MDATVGSPIFALSGDDFLTASSGKDLLVFSQPIGHDTVYSFAAAQDQIDLIGYTGFTSFGEVQKHLTEDANGNAVITLVDGQSIVLQGVHAAALTENNFVFDQTPALDNAGTMTIADGAVMPLSGTINNTGTIELNSTGHATDLQIIEHGITLTGAGHVVLSDSVENMIVGTSDDVTLTNVGSVISDGVLEARAGLLKVDGEVSGRGHALIDGGSMEFVAASDAIVQFSGSGSGTLVLDDVSHFTGSVTGFSYGDTIDLAGIDPANVNISDSGQLEVHYGPGAADFFSLVGNYDPSGFTLATDHNGGTDIVWNHQAPVVETDQFSIAQNLDGTTTISGLHISDSDPTNGRCPFEQRDSSDRLRLPGRDQHRSGHRRNL